MGLNTPGGRSRDLPTNQLTSLQQILGGTPLAGTPAAARPVANFAQLPRTTIPNTFSDGFMQLSKSLGVAIKHRRDQQDLLSGRTAGTQYATELALHNLEQDNNPNLTPEERTQQYVEFQTAQTNKYMEGLTPGGQAEFSKFVLSANQTGILAATKDAIRRQNLYGQAQVNVTLNNLASQAMMTNDITELGKLTSKANDLAKDYAAHGGPPAAAEAFRIDGLERIYTASFFSAAKNSGYVTVPAPEVDLKDPSGLVVPGNIDRTDIPVISVPDPKDSTKQINATIRTITVGSSRSGEELQYVIPTIAGGKPLSDEEAITLFEQTGNSFGGFKTVKEANEYAQLLHLDENHRIGGSVNIPVQDYMKSEQFLSTLIQDGLGLDAANKIRNSVQSATNNGLKDSAAAYGRDWDRFSGANITNAVLGQPLALPLSEVFRQNQNPNVPPDVQQQRYLTTWWVQQVGPRFRDLLDGTTSVTPATLQNAMNALDPRSDSAVVSQFDPQQLAILAKAHDDMATTTANLFKQRTDDMAGFLKLMYPNATPEQQQNNLNRIYDSMGIPPALQTTITTAQYKETAGKIEDLVNTASPADMPRLARDIYNLLTPGRNQDGSNKASIDAFRITNHMSGDKGKDVMAAVAMVSDSDADIAMPLIQAAFSSRSDIVNNLAATNEDFQSKGNVDKFLQGIFGKEITDALRVRQIRERSLWSDQVSQRAIPILEKYALKRKLDNPGISNDVIKNEITQFINGRVIDPNSPNQVLSSTPQQAVVREGHYAVNTNSLLNAMHGGNHLNTLGTAVDLFRKGKLGDLGITDAYLGPLGDINGASVGGYAHPVPGHYKISSRFGDARTLGPHDGIDYTVPKGTSAAAIQGGVIEIIENNGRAGNSIVIQLDDGSKVLYGHLSGFSVANGTRVSKGDIIGYTGGVPGEPGAGNSTGAHLHLSVTGPDGEKMDPYKLLYGNSKEAHELLNSTRTTIDHIRENAMFVSAGNSMKGYYLYLPKEGSFVHGADGKMVIIGHDRVISSIRNHIVNTTTKTTFKEPLGGAAVEVTTPTIQPSPAAIELQENTPEVKELFENIPDPLSILKGIKW